MEMGACGSCVRMMLGVEADVKIHVIEPTTQNGPYEQPSFQLVQNGEAVVNERRQNRSTSAPIVVVPPSTTLQVPSLIPGLSIVRD